MSTLCETELRNPHPEFMSRHTTDGKFSFVDHRSVIIKIMYTVNGKFSFVDHRSVNIKILYTVNGKFSFVNQ